MDRKKSSVLGNNVFAENTKLLIINTMIAIALFFLFSIIILFTDISKSYYKLAIIGYFAIIGLICGYISGKTKKQRGMLYGIIFSLPICLVFVVISLISNDFQFNFMAAVSIIICLIFSAFGGIVSVNTKKRRK